MCTLAILKSLFCVGKFVQVHIKLNQFIKGYSDGHKSEDGKFMMLKLKEWPPASVLEEFLLCQRPEFVVNFPLVDFIHPKWGLLNLAAKLPPDTLQSEVGLKLVIAYGRQQEFGKGDSVTNLMIKMGDVVSRPSAIFAPQFCFYFIGNKHFSYQRTLADVATWPFDLFGDLLNE
jgi:lysine-specific demethylase 3